MQGGEAAAKALPAGAIAALPLDPDDVWEAAVTQLSQRVAVKGQAHRPWVALVLAHREGLILWHDVFIEQPQAGALATAVRMAMASPAAGPPRRPRQILVRDADDALALRGLSDEAGFTSEIVAELPAVEDALAGLTEHMMGGEPAVVVCRTPGLARADLERYYTVAAEFYRARPWKQFEMDEVVAIDGLALQASRRFALIMGQSGITLGLAVYDDLKQIQQTFANPGADVHKDLRGFSMVFGEEEELAPADVDAIEQFGWPVATPEAYPAVFRVLPGPKVETPTADEMRYIAAALDGSIRLAESKERQTTIAAPGVTLQLTRLGNVDDL
jgi:hypothetical protein